MELNIDSSAVVKFTNTLEKLHRSALPVAIRQTLNKVALDVKKDTLLKHSKKDFVNRQANFFKANSKVEFATGFNVNSMKATIGMVSTSLKGKDNYAVKDLEEQEGGGTIKGKAFIPMKPARSGDNNKIVKPNARLSKIKSKGIVNAKAKPGSAGFIKSVVFAGKGGYVLAKKNSKEILWRVDSIRKNRFKLTPLYSVKKGRTISVKPTHFMRSASLESAKNMEHLFIAEAKIQIKRLGAK